MPHATDSQARAMTDQPAEPTPGPYEIWGEDEQVPGVPCIEIGRGEGGTPACKTICYVDCTLDETTDEFILTPEDHANARLLAASWATAVERDRLVKALTPSTETKIAYMGEFSYIATSIDEDGNPQPVTYYVPWRTIREIMAAILAEARQS